MKRLWQAIATASYSRTIGVIALLIVIAAIPLTVFISQKQQEIRQQAATCSTIGVLDCSACKSYQTCVPSQLGPMYPNNPNPIPRYDCCSTSTITKTPTVTPNVTSPPTAPGDIKSCSVCNTGIKFCGTVWTQSAGTLCSSTPPNDGTAKVAADCKCTSGSAGSCAGQDTSKCVVTPVPDKCVRCSDTFKYCKVSYDRDPSGVCGNGDSASGKVYTVDCGCSYGQDYGTCGGASTASCLPTESVQCDTGIVCTGTCRAKVGVCGPAEKSGCKKTKLASNPNATCVPVAVANQPCEDVQCPTGTCDTKTGTCTNSIKSCSVCNTGIKFCGTVWTVTDNSICSSTPPSTAKVAVDCKCTSGSAGSCAGQDTSKCVVTPVPDKCVRCSDTFKYCKVSYDRDPSGVCGNGDSASGKVYTVDCGCTYGTDYGSCAGLSTSVCSVKPPTATPTLTSTPTPTKTTVTLTPKLTSKPPTSIPTSPPTTPQPGDTMIAFTIGLDGIGTTGDNRTTEYSGSNKNPLHPTRNLKVLVLDSQNNEVVNKSGEMSYNSSTGKFEGTANIGQITTGSYLVKVSTDAHLRRLIPGIQTLTSGQTNTMQLVNLVAGDVNNDNRLDILDYNILLSCSEDPAINNPDNGALCNQDPNSKIFSDLEDNGVVNQFDYNLFVREYAVQNGD